MVWSGGNIPVGVFVDFNIDASGLPNVPTLELKAVQTYSNGDIVRWIDTPAAPGQPDPPHPQPTLAPTPAPSGSASTPTTAAAAAPAPAKGPATSGDVNGAKAISMPPGRRHRRPPRGRGRVVARRRTGG